MTFEAVQDRDTAHQTDASPREIPVRNGRIVTPEAAAAIDAQRAIEAKFHACFVEMRKQFAFVVEGSLVAGRLKTLATLSEQGLVATDGEGDAIEHGYLIADIIKTMADRLEALEARARESLAHLELKVAR